MGVSEIAVAQSANQEEAAHAAVRSVEEPRGNRLACDAFPDWLEANRRWLFITLGIIYLAGFTGQWRPEPDSALYLTIGRNLAQGQGYTYHGQPHHLVFPGLPLMFAATFLVGGTGQLLTAHVLMLLCGAAALALTYRLFLLHSGRPVAVLITLMVGLSRTFYRYNFELLSDLPFLMFVMAFLVGYEAIVHRKAADPATGTTTPHHRLDWYLLGIGIVGTVITRPAMLAVLLAVGVAVAWSLARGKLRWGAVGMLVAVISAGVLFYLVDPRRQADRGTYGGYEMALLNTQRIGSLIRRAFTENLWQIFHPTVAEAVFGLDLGKAINPLVSLVLLVVAFTLFRYHLVWGMLVVTTLLMMGIQVHVRYMLFILPLLMYANWRALVWLNHRLGPARGSRVVVALLVVLGLTNVIRLGGFILEQRTIPMLQAYKGGKYASLPERVRRIQEVTEPGDWILVQRKLGRILTFASRRYAVEPDMSTRLDPDLQAIWALEPLDVKDSDGTNTQANDWLRQHDYELGPEVFSVKAPADRQPWVLHRVVKKAVAPPPATAPSGGVAGT